MLLQNVSLDHHLSVYNYMTPWHCIVLWHCVFLWQCIVLSFLVSKSISVCLQTFTTNIHFKHTVQTWCSLSLEPVWAYSGKTYYTLLYCKAMAGISVKNLSGWRRRKSQSKTLLRRGGGGGGACQVYKPKLLVHTAFCFFLKSYKNLYTTQNSYYTFIVFFCHFRSI